MLSSWKRHKVVSWGSELYCCEALGRSTGGPLFHQVTGTATAPTDCQEPAVSTVKRKADRERPREPNVDPDSPNFSEARTSQATLPARPQAGLPRLLSGKPPLVATSTLLPQAAGGSCLPFPTIPPCRGPKALPARAPPSSAPSGWMRLPAGQEPRRSPGRIPRQAPPRRGPPGPDRSARSLPAPPG